MGSHQDWATAKLSYTIEIASNLKINGDDKSFVDQLQTFLSSLKKIHIAQKQIVADYDQNVNELESNLTRIRRDMIKIKTMTYKKIYDLHKQVQLAQDIELGIM